MLGDGTSSEEFLRQYSSGEKITQTIDEAVLEGADLFGGDYQSKSDRNVGKRTGTSGGDA